MEIISISNIGKTYCVFKKAYELLRVMKLILLLLWISLPLTFAAPSYAQTASLSLDMAEKTVTEVLRAIESQSEFHFFYNNLLIDMNRRVTVNVRNQDVFTVLDKLFKGTGVQYKVIDKDVILTSVASQSVPQTERPLTGTVTDSKGEPVIGANVVVKGTARGTITDIDGNFL